MVGFISFIESRACSFETLRWWDSSYSSIETRGPSQVVGYERRHLGEHRSEVTLVPWKLPADRKALQLREPPRPQKRPL